MKEEAPVFEIFTLDTEPLSSWLSKVLHVDIFRLGKAERTKQGNLLTNQVLAPGRVCNGFT